MANVVPDFIVNSKSLDVENEGKEETYWYFSEAQKNYGYYFQIPEIHSAANSLATWAVGKGWTIELASDTVLKATLENIKGNGADSFQTIMYNHILVKKIVGDSFIEVVSSDKGTVLNLLPLSPERVRIVYKKATILRYDVWDGAKWKPIKKEKMIHSSNNRIGDQMHGTSQIDACRWVIDARNEALVDNRKIEHRGMALGIAYYKTNNAGKISFANKQIEQAVKKGEMVGLPEDTVQIEQFPSKDVSDRMGWIQYLENFFYQTFGVPRSIATSDGTSEVGGKMGHVIFEPHYTREQVELENQLWLKLGWKIKFNRPPSLGGLIQDEEQKNTGQLNIQPNDVSADLERE